MIRRRALALSALLASLAACDATERGKDGYAFDGKQFEQAEVEVRLVTYADPAELREAMTAHGITHADTAAFGVLRPPFDRCEVHIVDPAVRYEPEWLGHEIAHCFYGQWHPREGG